MVWGTAVGWADRRFESAGVWVPDVTGHRGTSGIFFALFCSFHSLCTFFASHDTASLVADASPCPLPRARRHTARWSLVHDRPARTRIALPRPA
jgi:hypothetical protein